MNWTAERIEYVIDQFNSGNSAGTIAACLGVTRSSVTGVLHRLGIQRPPGERAGPESVWNAASDEILRAHYGKESVGKIAEMIGQGVTRGAVIGRARRIGVAATGSKPCTRNLDEDRARSSRYYREVTKPKLQAQAKVRDHKKGSFYRSHGAPKPATIPPEPLPAPDMRMVPLTALTPFVCHFPVGDPKATRFGFCGAPKSGPGSYCNYHHRIAYHAVSDRRERLETLARAFA